MGCDPPNLPHEFHTFHQLSTSSKLVVHFTYYIYDINIQDKLTNITICQTCTPIMIYLVSTNIAGLEEPGGNSDWFCLSQKGGEGC